MNDVAVVRAGVRCPIGLDARQTGFLLRAGLPALGESPLADGRGEPVTMAYLPVVDPSIVGADRLTALAVPAAEQAVAVVPGARLGLEQARLAVHVALDQDLAEGLLARTSLETALARLCPNATVSVAQQGEAALGLLLPELARSLESGSLDAALVGGVHSDYDPAVIARLEAAGRLFGRDNLDARLPGEAAAFVLLTRADRAQRFGLAPLGRIVGVGAGLSRVRPDNDEPAARAEGLTDAVRQAAASLLERQETAGWTFVDLTSEMWRLHEWEAVFVRSQQVLGKPYRVEAPAQRIGYLGAAAMPLFMAMAATAWRHGYAPSPTMLATAAADQGGRMALVMQRA